MMPYYRATYIMQFIAALCVAATMLLPWHVRRGTGIDLLSVPIDTFSFPVGLFHPLWLLWMIPMAIFISVVRSSYSYVDFRYAVWWQIQRNLLILSALVMVWILLATDTRALQSGYWLGNSSLALLAFLAGIERVMPEKTPEQFRAASGVKQDCPYCGRVNPITARRCWNCGLPLFPNEK